MLKAIANLVFSYINIQSKSSLLGYALLYPTQPTFANVFFEVSNRDSYFTCAQLFHYSNNNQKLQKLQPIKYSKEEAIAYDINKFARISEQYNNLCTKPALDATVRYAFGQECCANANGTLRLQLT